MIRTQEATGKTVDEARTNACALLGVEKDDINVSYDCLLYTSPSPRDTR